MAANVIRKVKLTAYQWDWLFKQLVNFEMPEKLAETAYDKEQRSIVKDEVRQAIAEMKKHSYYPQKLGPDNRFFFGAKEDWEESRNEKGILDGLKHIKPDREYVLAFGEAAVSGLCWWAYLAVTPATITHEKVRGGEEMMIASHSSASPVQCVAFVWPLVEGLGRVKAVREAAGLDKSEKKRRWEDDPVEPMTTLAEAAKSEIRSPNIV